MAFRPGIHIPVDWPAAKLLLYQSSAVDLFVPETRIKTLPLAMIIIITLGGEGDNFASEGDNFRPPKTLILSPSLYILSTK